MKRITFVITAAAVCCLFTRPADGVNVCNYTVRAAFGFGCPMRNDVPVCISVSAAIGQCDVPVECYGTSGVSSCRLLLAPRSGPQPQCAFSSRRPVGFRCFKNPRLFPTQSPSPVRTPTGTPLPSVTPTPGSTDFVAFVKTVLASTDPEPIRVNGIQFTNQFTNDTNAFCDVLPPNSCEEAP